MESTYSSIVDSASSGQAAAAYFETRPEEVSAFVDWYLDSRRESARVLLELVEWSFCAAPPAQFFANMREQGLLVRKVCGRVWRCGETAYRCRTCELDSTSALCTECFDPSRHQGHDFCLTMADSGCCDCGDSMAMREGGFCQRHPGLSDADRPELLLAEPVRARLRHAVAALLARARPDNLPDRRPDLAFVAPQLLAFLRRLVKRGGDSFRAVIALETIAVPSSTLQAAAAAACSSSSSSPPSSWLCAFLKKDAVRWIEERLRTEGHELLHALLPEPRFKRQMALEFARVYRNAIQSSTSAEPSPLLSRFSVQLFTVPGLVALAAREAHLLENLACLLKDILVFAKIPVIYRRQLDVLQLSHSALEAWRLSQLCADLRYVLQGLEAARLFIQTPQVFEAWQSTLIMLQDSGAHSCIPPGRGHVPFETREWMRGFSLELSLLLQASLLAKAVRFGAEGPLPEPPVLVPDPPFPPTDASPSRDLLRLALHTCLESLAVCVSSTCPAWELSPPMTMAMENHNFYSYHLPLHRFLGLLLCSAVRQFGAALDLREELATAIEEKMAPRMGLENTEERLTMCALSLALHPLRCISVACTQVPAGLWRRNGLPAVASALMYRSVHCVDLMFDTDIFLLQALLASGLLPADVLLRQAVQEFLLVGFIPDDDNYARPNTSAASAAPPAGETKVQHAEDLLKLVIWLVQERAKAGPSDAVQIRREILHRLATGNHTHSELLHTVPRRLAQHPLFEPTLRELAVFEPPRQMEPGQYVLRPEYWREYDRWNAHYSSRDLQRAEERYAEARRVHSLPATTQVQLAPLCPSLSRLPSLLLESNFLHHILYCVLRNHARAPPTYSSDTLLAAALHLLRLALSLESPGHQQQSSAEPGLAAKLHARGMHGLLLECAAREEQPELRRACTDLANLMESLASAGLAAGANAHAQQALVEQPQSKIEDRSSEESSAEIAERRRRARERQAEIMAKFASQQRQFELSAGLREDVDEGSAKPDTTMRAEQGTQKNEDSGGVGASAEEDPVICALCREAGGSLRDNPVALISYSHLTNLPLLARIFASAGRIAPPPKLPDHAEQSDWREFSENFDKERIQDEEAEQEEAVEEEEEENGDNGEGEEYSDVEDEEPVVGEEADEDEVQAAESFMRSIEQGDLPDLPPGEFEMDGMDQEEEDVEELDEDDVFHLDAAARSAESSDLRDQMEHFSLYTATLHPPSSAQAPVQETYLEPAEPPRQKRRLDSEAKNSGADMTGLESDNELPPLIDEDEVACETRDKDTPSLMEDISPLVDSEDEEMPGLEDIPSSAPIEGLGTAPQPSPLLSAQLLPAEESSQSTRTRPVQRTAHLVHLPRLQPQQQRQQGEPASVQIRNLYRNMFNLFNDAMIQQMPHREQHQHHHHHRAGRHSHHHRRQQISEFDELEEAAEGEPEEPVNVGSDADGEAEVGQDVEGRSGGIGIGFCGHRVHIDCFDRYFSALVRSHVHGDEYEGDRLVLLERLEFLCPVCRRLANCLVPLVPVSLYADLLPPLPPASFPLQQPPLSLADFDSWLLKAPMLTSSCPQPQHQPSEEQKRLAASALEQVMDTFVGRLVSVQKGRSHEYAVSDSPSTPYVWSTFSLLLCLHEINSRGTDSLALPDPLRQLAQTIFRIGFVHKADDKAARQRYRDLLRRQLLGHPLERRAQQAPEEISPEHHWEAFLFSPVLAADPFALLCRLAFLWPEPLDLPRLLALVRLMYLVVVCQCLLSLALHTPEPQRSSWLQSAGPPPPSVSAVASPTALFALLAALIPPEEGSQNAASSLPEAFCPQPRPVPAGPRVPELEHALETLLEPFLRRATLLLMTWNDLRLQPAADASLPPAPSPVSTSPAHLRAFLSLPAPEELFVPGALNGASGFAVHTWIRQLLQAMSDERAAEQPALPWQIIPQVTPALPLQLTPLPPLYHDLIARVADADCLECEEPCGQATLCLVCGATVCSNTECVPSHADACCAGNGLFLVVPTTEVLLLRGERYAFWGSLYLDKHGEPDPELRRGRPLYLNQDRVALLTRLFLKQVWEHDTRVLESTHLFEDHPPAHFRHGA